MITTGGGPLVLFSDIAVCGAGRHECVLVTDGLEGYAFADKGEGELTLVREGVLIQGSCPVVFRGEPCGTHVEWDLSTEAWGPASNANWSKLFQFAKPIEKGDASE